MVCVCAYGHTSLHVRVGKYTLNNMENCAIQFSSIKGCDVSLADRRLLQHTFAIMQSYTKAIIHICKSYFMFVDHIVVM